MSLLVAVIAGLVGVALYQSASDRVPVLAASRDIVPGERIAAGDLVVVQVATDGGVATISAVDRDRVVGQMAVSGLAEGQLLAPGAIADQAPIAEGEAVVGLVLTPGQYPPGLRPGDTFLAVERPAEGAAADQTPGADPPQVRVLSVRPPDDTHAAFSVALVVPLAAAEDLAQLAADGRLLLVGIDGDGDG